TLLPPNARASNSGSGPESPGDDHRRRQAGEVGHQTRRQRVAVADDAHRAAIDAEHVEGGFGRALQDRTELSRVGIGAKPGRGEDVTEQPERSRAGERPDDRHRQHLGGQTEGSGDGRQHLGERVHRAGAPEGPDRRQDGDEERNDPHRDVEALFRALDEGLVDLDAPDPAVERDADQQHDQDPARRDLDEGLHFQTRSSTLAETIATVSAQIVAPRQGRMIPAGSLECAEARSAITVVGTSCSEAVLMARNNTCALVAVPGAGFSFSSSSIALIPNGVAALPSPIMFAAMFSSMAEMAGCPSGMPGKRGRKMGRAARASFSTSPAFSAIRISPSHSAITPISPMASVTPCDAPSNAPCPTALMSPRTAPAIAAATRSSTNTRFMPRIQRAQAQFAKVSFLDPAAERVLLARVPCPFREWNGCFARSASPPLSASPRAAP